MRSVWLWKIFDFLGVGLCFFLMEVMDWLCGVGKINRCVNDLFLKEKGWSLFLKWGVDWFSGGYVFEGRVGGYLEMVCFFFFNLCCFMIKWYGLNLFCFFFYGCEYLFVMVLNGLEFWYEVFFWLWCRVGVGCYGNRLCFYLLVGFV